MTTNATEPSWSPQVRRRIAEAAAEAKRAAPGAPGLIVSLDHGGSRQLGQHCDVCGRRARVRFAQARPVVGVVVMVAVCGSCQGGRNGG